MSHSHDALLPSSLSQMSVETLKPFLRHCSELIASKTDGKIDELELLGAAPGVDQIQLDLKSDGLSLMDKELIEEILHQSWDQLWAPPEGQELKAPLINFRRKKKLVAETQMRVPFTAQNILGMNRQRTRIPGVKNVVLVYSAKGGVGKSTISANLAVAMGRAGLKAGLFDADLQGPSQAAIMGLCEPHRITSDGKLVPHHKHHVDVVSFGLFTGDQVPFVARGAILAKTLDKLIKETAWGDLDFLIIDLPPGTGDTQMNLIENYHIDAGLLVTTPQQIALLDAHKGLSFFEKYEVPVLGLIENMAFHVCSNCGHHEHLFGAGAESFAKERNLPLLAKVPLDAEIGTSEELGQPICLASEVYGDLFAQMVERIELEIS